MRYTDEDALKEVLKRKNTVIRKRMERTCRYLATAGTGLFAALIAVICLLPSGVTGTGTKGSVYGAFLLGRQAGGYVLVSVIAFVLGIAVTMLCNKYRSLTDKGKNTKTDTDQTFLTR